MGAFNCPKCGKTTGGNEKFCNSCGQALDIVCPACGDSWRFMFQYRYCPSCGNTMSKAAEKKTVKETR